VYQIVQAHEGKVWARSETGKGTSFVLRLRRMQGAAASAPAAAANAAGGARVGTVGLMSTGGKTRG
jgi:hypothetical protein